VRFQTALRPGQD